MSCSSNKADPMPIPQCSEKSPLRCLDRKSRLQHPTAWDQKRRGVGIQVRWHRGVVLTTSPTRRALCAWLRSRVDCRTSIRCRGLVQASLQSWAEGLSRFRQMYRRIADNMPFEGFRDFRSSAGTNALFPLRPLRCATNCRTRGKIRPRIASACAICALDEMGH